MLRSIIAMMVIAFTSAQTDAQEPIPFGISLDNRQAKALLAASEAEAAKNGWPVAIAVVDTGGYLIAFSKRDNTQLGSIEVAIQKAKTAALFRRPTKVFEELLESGGSNLRVLSLPGAIPLEGGLPVIINGKFVGAVGVSGVKSTEDAQVAKAGIDAIQQSP